MCRAFFCVGVPPREIANGALWEHGGCLVDDTDSMLLAAFTRPSSALRWAVQTVNDCLHADWPPELLRSELGEEISVGRVLPASLEESMELSSPDVHSRVTLPAVSQPGMLLLRGLRLRAGCDAGKVRDGLPSNGAVCSS